MRNQLNFDEIQERHLDTLIYMAFQQMDALDAQEASRESGLPPDAKEMETHAYSRFLQKQREVESKRRRASRRARRKHRLSQAISIAACLVVLLGIAAPFAVAYVPGMRSRVLGFVSAMAETTIIGIQPRRYEYIRSVYVNVTISGGVATVKGEATAGSGVRIAVTVQLQRKDGDKRMPIDTWSGGFDASGSKSISRGYQYRAYVTARAYMRRCLPG